MSGQDSDEDVPTLPADTLAILQEFYKQQESAASNEEPIGGEAQMPDEDWQLSQFWYDEHTATMLAREALAVAGEHGKIACLSCPTLYQKLRELKPATCQVVILEYDKRFTRFGEDFVFYDYNKPLDLAKELQKAFDIVVADPPFLAEECLLKTAQTIRYLSKEKLLLCTGAVMGEAAAKFLKAKPSQFLPKHTRNLANEFSCFTNYDPLVLDNKHDKPDL